MYLWSRTSESEGIPKQGSEKPGAERKEGKCRNACFLKRPFKNKSKVAVPIAFSKTLPHSLPSSCLKKLITGFSCIWKKSWKENQGQHSAVQPLLPCPEAYFILPTPFSLWPVLADWTSPFTEPTNTVTDLVKEKLGVGGVALLCLHFVREPS